MNTTKMRYCQLILPLVSMVFCMTEALAQVKLAPLFANNMVLQQQTNATIWGTAKAGEQVLIAPSWSSTTATTKADKEGNWKVSMATPKAGGPFDIKIKASNEIVLQNILIGEVWLCGGQSNMEMPLKGFSGQPITDSNTEIVHSKNPNIRWITVPRKFTTHPQTTFDGNWKVAAPATSGNFSATAYYFAKLLQETTGVPIGLIDVTYSGSNIEAWMNAETLQAYPNIEIPTDDEAIQEKNRTPTVLYNGMLNPVIGYSLRGVIWYQGESNATRPLQYEGLFPDMVKLWRDQWDQGAFPFYYVQIAPYNYNSYYREDIPWYANSAYLRDAQRKAQYLIPESGMACLLDVGDMNTIHPMDKKTPGERLAWLALAKTYGLKGFGYATPDYDELAIEDSLVTITFKNLSNGISSYRKKVSAFEIAGADQVFHPAQCKVRRKSVQVWSEKVTSPVAVRYAFTNEGPAQLFSTEGIPVSSFRTDNWTPGDESK